MSNKNKVRVLKAARKLIESGEHRYICHAISAASTEGTYSDALELRRLIRDRLQGRRVLEDWLCMEHGIRAHNEFGTTKKLITTRLAWIDSLIEEFS